MALTSKSLERFGAEGFVQQPDLSQCLLFSQQQAHNPLAKESSCPCHQAAHPSQGHGSGCSSVVNSLSLELGSPPAWGKEHMTSTSGNTTNQRVLPEGETTEKQSLIPTSNNFEACLTLASYFYSEVVYVFFPCKENILTNHYNPIQLTNLKVFKINFNAKQTPQKSALSLSSTSLALRRLWGRFACIYILLGTTSVILLPSLLSASFAAKECDASTPLPPKRKALDTVGSEPRCDPVSLNPQGISPHVHNSLQLHLLVQYSANIVPVLKEGSI